MSRPLFAAATDYAEEEITSAITRVESKFPNQIKRISYRIGEDWSGSPAIFFRVLLTANTTLAELLRLPSVRATAFELPAKITDSLRSELTTDVLQPYFAFRTVAEQEKLRDPDWEQ